MGIDAYVDDSNDPMITATEHHSNCAIIATPDRKEIRTVSMQNLFTNYTPHLSKSEPKEIHKSYAEQAGIPQ